jgi:hypothetical protein
MNSSWLTDNCEIVVAVQDMSTKEILNGAKAFFLQPTNDNDAAITEIIYPEDLVCGNELAPQIIIKNFGGEALTSLDIEYSLDGSEVFTYEWNGSVDFLFSESIELPAVMVDFNAGENTVVVNLSNPNGLEDADDTNNTASHSFEFLQSGVEVVMESYLGSQYAEELSWELLDPNGVVLAEDSYASSNNGQTISETFTLSEAGCHSLVWNDSYGDGFNGGGWCKIYFDGVEVYSFSAFSLQHITPWFTQIGEPLMGPVDPIATIIDYDIVFEWTAPAKATLLGYNIYEQSDLNNPINDELIAEESYEYTVPGNGDYAFYFTAVYEEGESNMVGPVEALITVGLNKLSNSQIQIYPNPAQDQLNIDLNQETQNVEVNIYSVSGELVISSLESSNKIQLNISKLENGVYFLELIANQKKSIQKISILK